MRRAILILLPLILTACTNQGDRAQTVQSQIDSLQKKLDNTYKPGLGEFMSSIQVHHAKLWFAGTNRNWKLADFEIQEIEEDLGNIQKFNADRPEVKSIGMIMPPIDSINAAIKASDEKFFERSFTTLTATCNNCHLATAHEFNVITIPTTPPLSNQVFKPLK